MKENENISELLKAAKLWEIMLTQEYERIVKSRGKTPSKENKKALISIEKRLIILNKEVKLIQNFKDLEI